MRWNVLYVDNAIDIYIKGLKDQQTGVIIDNADLRLSLHDDQGSTIASDIMMASMTAGEYRGTIPLSVTQNLAAGQRYKLVIQATNYGYKVEHWLPAQRRNR